MNVDTTWKSASRTLEITTTSGTTWTGTLWNADPGYTTLLVEVGVEVRIYNSNIAQFKSVEVES